MEWTDSSQPVCPEVLSKLLPVYLLLLLEVKVKVLTSPSFLASSVISMNFWISEMVGPVKSSTGIIVCFRLAEDRTVHYI